MNIYLGWERLPPSFACLCFLMVAMPADAEELQPLAAELTTTSTTSRSSDLPQGGGAPLALDAIVAGGTFKNSAVLQNPTQIEKPAYVVLDAELANWDSDLEPDGWRCRVQIRDQNDQPTRPRAPYATFELRLRIPRRDRNGFNEIITESVRWSPRLVYDNAGNLDVKLPLRSPLPAFHADGSRISRLNVPQRGSFSQREQLSERFRQINLASGYGWMTSIAETLPASGVMSVRVSLPMVGILEATDPVLADEPLLVDSNWPQR